MHFNEDRISLQLGMKLNVLERAVNELISIVSKITLDNQRLQRQIDALSRNGSSAPKETTNTNNDENYELDISQVQKILKQQSGPQTLGRRIDN